MPAVWVSVEILSLNFVTSVPTQWAADYEPKPAPEPLIRIRALINTVELPAGPDRLADPAHARPWLVANGLLSQDADLACTDLRLVRKVREALRHSWSATQGGPAPGDEELSPLRRIAADSAAHADLGGNGEVRLYASGDSVRARLVELLLIIRDWVFYDRSRNQGGIWCDMAACGNRIKNRDFRTRKREERGGKP